MTVYSCDKCKHNFKFQSIFKRHLQTSSRCKMSDEEIKLIINTINNLKKNTNTNTNINTIICKKCNFIFTKKSSLTYHQIHSKCAKNNINPIDTILDISNNNKSFNYIYLIEKFDVNNKEYIYKFGKTNREFSKRLKEHGDESKLLLVLDVNDCNFIEKKILNILKKTKNIKKCKFGKEYFICKDKEFLITTILKNIYNLE